MLKMRKKEIITYRNPEARTMKTALAKLLKRGRYISKDV